MDNFAPQFLSLLKKLLFYRPSDADPFVLDERPAEKADAPPDALARRTGELDALLRYARRLEAALVQAQQTLAARPDPAAVTALLALTASLEKQQAELSPLLLAYRSETGPSEDNVSASLEENLRTVRRLFRLPANKNIVVRPFFIPAAPPLKAALVFSKELVDKKDVTPPSFCRCRAQRTSTRAAVSLPPSSPATCRSTTPPRPKTTAPSSAPSPAATPPYSSTAPPASSSSRPKATSTAPSAAPPSSRRCAATSPPLLTPSGSTSRSSSVPCGPPIF